MGIEDLVETIDVKVSRTVSLGKDSFENIRLEAGIRIRKNVKYDDKELYAYGFKRCKEETDKRKNIIINGKPKEPEKKQTTEQKAEAMKKQDYINKFRRLYESIKEPSAFLKSFYEDVEHNTIDTIRKMLDTVHEERNKNNPL